jgi:hypothetical protein
MEQMETKIARNEIYDNNGIIRASEYHISFCTLNDKQQSSITELLILLLDHEEVQQ